MQSVGKIYLEDSGNHGWGEVVMVVSWGALRQMKNMTGF